MMAFQADAPLPQNPFDEMDDALFHDAYYQCLQSEAEAGTDKMGLVYARCLGYLILEAPDANGRRIIATEITECMANRELMVKLAKFYINHLFRLFRQNKGETPAPSEYPSQSFLQKHKSFFGVAIDPAPKDHLSAKKAALKRDGYRCMITRFVDISTYLEMTEAERVDNDMTGQILSTNYCHIFPPSANWDLQPQTENHPKTQYSGNLSSIVNGFGGIDVLAELDGTKIHRLSNGLTLSIQLRFMMDHLLLWFEEVPGRENTYTVCTRYTDPMLAALPHPLIITFTTDTNLELPDPKYLKLHAVVCRVAHMSGVARYLDLHDREVRETPVLAHDGSSADLLASRLHQVLVER